MRGRLAALLCLLALAAALPARAADAFQRIDQPGETHAESVAVSGPNRLIYLWGVAAEDEKSTKFFDPPILYPGDFAGQCAYAVDKMARLLATQGAGLADVVKLVTYVTDTRQTGDLETCLRKAFGPARRPAETVVSVVSLAHVGMLLEISAIAALADEPGRAFSKATEHVQANWSGGSTEVVTLRGADRTLYLAAGTPEDEAAKPARVRFPGDVQKQCAYTFDKLSRLLAHAGAGFGDMVRTTSYAPTDATIQQIQPCTTAAFRNSPRKATGVFTNLALFPLQGQTYAYDVTAVLPQAPGAPAGVRLEKVWPGGAPHRADLAEISGPRRTIYLSGVDAVDAAPPGDFAGQCAAVFDTARRRLRAQQAGLNDTVRLVLYLSDPRWLPDFDRCARAAFGRSMEPPRTVVMVNGQTHPGALLQLDLTGAVADPPAK